LVEIETDNGITGVGSCSGNGVILNVIIDKILKPFLLGADPREIQKIWDKCYYSGGVRAFGSRGVGVVAQSGVDIALWDILGKVENRPVYELLGGACRERVQLYATALYPEATSKVVEKALAFARQGFRGMKIKVGFDLAKDIEIVRAVRAALGRNYTLMTDANMGYKLDAALEAAAAFRECGVYWLEEPLFVEAVEDHATLRAGSKVPIALGENLHTCFAFEAFIARKAIDFLQPDVARTGGISEIRKIAMLAGEHSFPISFHTYGDAVALAASLHLAVALENSIIMELDCSENPLRTDLLTEPLEQKDGFMTPPQGPGLGIELNSEVLQRYSFTGEEDLRLMAPVVGSG
jgi:D-galactarolactone cycloisomerase